MFAGEKTPQSEIASSILHVVGRLLFLAVCAEFAEGPVRVYNQLALDSASFGGF
jgi:hypothetical protein